MMRKTAILVLLIVVVVAGGAWGQVYSYMDGLRFQRGELSDVEKGLFLMGILEGSSYQWNRPAVPIPNNIINYCSRKLPSLRYDPGSILQLVNDYMRRNSQNLGSPVAEIVALALKAACGD